MQHAAVRSTRWRQSTTAESCARISNLTIHASVVAISTQILLCASESADPLDPKFVRAFAPAIRPGWRLRSMTPVAIRNLRARDRPMHMRNALVVWVPRMSTTGAVPSATHTAVAAPRSRSWWTTCGGTQSPRLGDHCCRQCTYSLGRGSVHFVGADSVVASKTKDDRAGLRVPLPLVIRGVRSPERQCRRQTIPGWPSGHGAVRCAQPVNED